eukprot:7844592-Alexandrium_andersonii.AAC.1
MSDGLNKYLRRLAHLLGRSSAPANGPSWPADVVLTALLPRPKSARLAKHLKGLADLARRASRA